MPNSGLVDMRGTLYGTTPSGGNALCYEITYTCGIVYSITTTGKEKVLYTFSPTNDDAGGAHPSAGLVNMNGVLYGTAPVGGNGYGCNNNGCGVVYSLTTTGLETVLHVFNGGSYGARPNYVYDIARWQRHAIRDDAQRWLFELPQIWDRAPRLWNRLRIDALAHAPPPRPRGRIALGA